MNKEITKEVIAEHGLSESEYEMILSILGREPNFTELGIFSVMWSEHCSYKSSRKHLGTLPTKAPYVVHGPGENAGVVDIGDGFVAVFKMESHNHPSFIEPYEGAATGVGGILRDVFTMGARPVALLDSLRFGSPEHPRTKYLVDGVVSGISGYGNCVGVPTVGGEMFFNGSYDGNILVNVFCLGIAKKDKIFTGICEGVGNPVIYVGSKTGRDGIHGATMASGEFDEKSEEKRPTVQVGDPFTEKLLIEACLEAMKSDAILGIQDMGAAGLTSSSCEMAGRGGTGIEMNIDDIPRREEGMTAYELLLSESQERMLIVAKRGREEELINIYKKWGLEGVVVGKVTGDGLFRIVEKGETVVEIPVADISNKAPIYDRPSKRPAYLDALQNFDTDKVAEPKDYNQTLLKLIGSLNLGSKEWVYQQYDHTIRTDTVTLPGSDASVIRVKGTKKGIAITSDCNPRLCYLDPYMGGAMAVAEAARNIACSGGKPMAITDNLNFGNPEKPEVMWQMKEAIRGISDACVALGTPVVSGNVSLYNETNGIGIYPTPTIGAIGVVEDIKKCVTQYIKGEGELLFLIGSNKKSLAGSEYLSLIHGLEKGTISPLDLDTEKRLQTALLAAIDKEIIRSAHDCSEGGLAITIAESCMSGDKTFGAEVSIEDDGRIDNILFGEGQSRIIVSILDKDRNILEELFLANGIETSYLGKTGGVNLSIRVNNNQTISCPIEQIKKAWAEAIPSYMA
ncbi:MAG: phosphoribosylformylglycinamidine synthase subunit PurL [Nitrospinota bacterium]|nr:phosphoribosylformylglycinamidine synthase subunit PurL [Nitrospinota bacterium]